MTVRFKVLLLLSVIAVVLVFFEVVSDNAMQPAGNLNSSPNTTEDQANIRSSSEAGASLLSEAPASNDMSGVTTDEESALKRYIEFPDGDRVEITFRNGSLLHQVPPGLDNGEAPGFHDRLAPLAAQGDAAAAYRLYESLRKCRNAARTEADLNDSISQLHATFSVPDQSIEGATRILGTGTNLDLQIATMRSQFDRCRGVTEAQIAASNDYLEIAADAGVYPATLQYAQLIVGKDPARAKSYFEIAWESGDAKAAFELAKQYRDGYSGMEPDRVTAYAYLYVGAKASELMFEGRSGEVFDTVKAAIHEKSSRMMVDFTPYEIEAAIPIAKSLLEDNDKCCLY